VALCKLGVELMREWRNESQKLWGSDGQFLDSQVFNYSLHKDHIKIRSSLTCNQVSIFFRRLGDVLGAKISAHRIRHRTATQLARIMHPKELMDFLGHTQFTTTALYLWPELKLQALAVDGFVDKELAGKADTFKMPE
jgi:integrase